MTRDERRSGPAEGLTHHPFAKAFGRAVPSLPPGPADGAASQASVGHGAPQRASQQREASAAPVTGANVVVQVERKGHGGKSVTRVRGLAAGQVGDLDEAARELRRTLGAGARAERGELIVQGEHVERLERWLRDRGVHMVVRGNR